LEIVGSQLKVIRRLKKIVREPLVHFLLLGAGIYALYGLVADNQNTDDQRVVSISAGEVQTLADQWARVWSRPPTDEELAGVIRGLVREQILYREAIAMGLDNGDVVIERRLAQRVELLARSLITPAEPTDEDLQSWYGDNPEAFKQPDLYSITQIFFNPDSRQEKTLSDAEALLDRLAAIDGVPADFADYGDSLMLQNHYENRSAQELTKLFGAGFVEQVVDLQPGVWHGPILSGYGAHLVLVNDVHLSPPPPFSEVRAELEEQWMGEQIDELSERFLNELISRYEVDVEETQVPITIPGRGATP
jgi:peptidyl-prolyl cis-trans isomerase C